MNDQKSEGTHLPHNKGHLDGVAERGLRCISTGSAYGTCITAKRERIEATQEQQAHFIASGNWSCKTRYSRVQYNIDVVKRTPKLQVRDAV
jgi:hypothetical protein